MFIKTLSNHHLKRFNVDILENNNHAINIYIYKISWKFEFKSQFSGNTTKTSFNWTKYVLGNECKYSIIKAYLLDFLHKPIYILHSNHQKHFQCVTKKKKTLKYPFF
jgi:hypothetical protein